MLRGRGRAVFTAWIPEGAMFDVTRDRWLALERLSGPTRAGVLAWHELDPVAEAFAPYGFEISVEERELAFTATSPDDFVDVELSEHPMWVLARSVLEPRDEWEPLQQQARETFRAANEDPCGFRVTSRYVVMTAMRY